MINIWLLISSVITKTSLFLNIGLFQAYTRHTQNICISEFLQQLQLTTAGTGWSNMSNYLVFLIQSRLTNSTIFLVQLWVCLAQNWNLLWSSSSDMLNVQVFLAWSLLNKWWHIPRHTTIHANSHALTLKNTQRMPPTFCHQSFKFHFLSICQKPISTFPTGQPSRILPQLLQCFPWMFILVFPLIHVHL